MPLQLLQHSGWNRRQVGTSLHNEEEESICFPTRVKRSTLPFRTSVLVLAVGGITAPRAVCLKLTGRLHMLFVGENGA